MSLRIRRGTNAQRAGITFDLGEIAYTTDTKKLYIGDGTTVGGKHVLATSAGNGFTFNENTQQIEFSLDNLDLENLNLSTTGVPEGTRLYFTTERAQDAVAAALVAGNPFNVGVTFTYDNANNRITAVSTGGSGLTTVSSDTNPSLGGNLSLNGFNISGSGNISATSLSSTTLTVTNLGGNLNGGAYNITNIGNIGATTITAANLGSNLAAGSYNITGVGNLSATTLTAANLGGNLNAGTYNITNIGSIGAATITATNLGGNLNTGSYNLTGTGNITTNTITATNLGGDLSLNSHNINGFGDIVITGTIQATGGLRLPNAGIVGDRIFTNDSNVFGFSVYTKQNNDFDLNYYRGATNAAKTAILPGDNLGQLTFKAWNGTTFDCISVGINASVNGDATMTDLFPKSLLRIFVGGGGSDSPQIATFNYLGVFNAPALQTTVYSVAGTALPSAAAVGEGARAFVSDATATTFASSYTGGGSNKVPVYSDGTVWRIG